MANVAIVLVLAALLAAEMVVIFRRGHMDPTLQQVATQLGLTSRRAAPLFHVFPSDSVPLPLPRRPDEWPIRQLSAYPGLTAGARKDH
jgi:hypothetical protein